MTLTSLLTTIHRCIRDRQPVTSSMWDALLTLAETADSDLAALRIEHAAWGAIIDVTRKDRDALRARVAELERLQASIHKAADAARKAERADVVAWLHGPCGDPAHDPRWCETCEARKDYATSIEEGAHEGAAGGS